MEIQGRHKRDRTLSLEGKRAWTCPGSEGERAPLVVLTVSKVAGPCAESRGYDGTPRMEMIREGGKTPWGVVG